MGGGGTVNRGMKVYVVYDARRLEALDVALRALRDKGWTTIQEVYGAARCSRCEVRLLLNMLCEAEIARALEHSEARARNHPAVTRAPSSSS